ncbi:hypothetical protein Bca4012_066902 [Brassica carinata]
MGHVLTPHQRGTRVTKIDTSSPFSFTTGGRLENMPETNRHLTRPLQEPCIITANTPSPSFRPNRDFSAFSLPVTGAWRFC